MKTRILLLQGFLCMGLTSLAQMKIGNNPTTINSASLLELESTNKGFVLPRLLLSSTSSVSPLSATALNGTMIYNTNNALSNSPGRGIYYWDSTNVRWIPLSPFQSFGTTNYVAKWINAYTIGTSTILYDNGSSVGINTTSPQNTLDVVGSQAVGSYAGSATAPSNGLIVSGAVGVGTSSPAAGSKLDVAGSFKLGSVGTIEKNVVSFATAINVTVVPQFSALTVLGLTVLGLNSGTNYTDVNLTLPVTLSSAQVTVYASPTFDLPAGVSIAYCRIVSATQIRIRFINSGTSNQTVNGNFTISLIEF